MKRKAIIISLSVLAIMLLVSIGFAGWSITNSHEQSDGGNFTAYSVSSDGAVTVQIVASNDINATSVDNPSIVFGKHTGADETTVWLTEVTMDDESLVAYVKVTLSGYTVNSNLVLDVTHAYNKTVDTTLIGGPAITEGAKSNASFSNNQITFTADGYIILVVTYKWGSHFTPSNDNTPVNPYYFYNRQTKTDDLVADAAQWLKALNTLVNGLTFTISVSDHAA